MSETLVMDEIAAALSDSINPCDRLAHWTLCWTLARGQLTCNRCLATQTTRQVGQPFLHRAACQGSGEQRYPLQELNGLLTRLAQYPAPTSGGWRTDRPR